MKYDIISSFAKLILFYYSVLIKNGLMTVMDYFVIDYSPTLLLSDSGWGKKRLWLVTVWKWLCLSEP